MRALAGDPLVSVGVHSVSHPMLARLAASEAEREMGDARDELRSRLGVEVTSIAYPYGSPGACGAREFETAKRLGFVAGVTTMRGNLRRAHRESVYSLPRHTLGMVPHCRTRYLGISLNGVWDAPITKVFVKR